MITYLFANPKDKDGKITIIDNIVRAGHLELLIWLRSLALPFFDRDPLKAAKVSYSTPAAYGNLIMAQWIYDIYRVSSIIDDDSNPFDNYSHFDIMSQDSSVMDDSSTITCRNIIEQNFTKCCCCGFLAEAQWLYSINPHIDIHASETKILKWTCRQGHLDVLQWLHMLCQHKHGNLCGFYWNDVYVPKCHSHIREWINLIK
jgi:hypothetical protein